MQPEGHCVPSRAEKCIALKKKREEKLRGQERELSGPSACSAFRKFCSHIAQFPEHSQESVASQTLPHAAPEPKQMKVREVTSIAPVIHP